MANQPKNVDLAESTVRQREDRLDAWWIANLDEASLDLVRQALDKEPEPPPRPRGLTTKEAAAALGISYEVLVQRMKPLRQELCLPLRQLAADLQKLIERH